jgi:hypothetical protein
MYPCYNLLFSMSYTDLLLDGKGGAAGVCPTIECDILVTSAHFTADVGEAVEKKELTPVEELLQTLQMVNVKHIGHYELVERVINMLELVQNGRFTFTRIEQHDFKAVEELLFGKANVVSYADIFNALYRILELEIIATDTNIRYIESGKRPKAVEMVCTYFRLGANLLAKKSLAQRCLDKESCNNIVHCDKYHYPQELQSAHDCVDNLSWEEVYNGKYEVRPVKPSSDKKLEVAPKAPEKPRAPKVEPEKPREHEKWSQRKAASPLLKAQQRPRSDSASWRLSDPA